MSHDMDEAFSIINVTRCDIQSTRFRLNKAIDVQNFILQRTANMSKVISEADDLRFVMLAVSEFTMMIDEIKGYLSQMSDAIGEIRENLGDLAGSRLTPAVLNP